MSIMTAEIEGGAAEFGHVEVSTWEVEDEGRGEEEEQPPSTIALAAGRRHPFAWLTFLYVLPEWRGRGLGERVVWKVVEMVRAANIETILLIVGLKNTKAMKFYERIGFKNTG